jgi:hypothetical protein
VYLHFYLHKAEVHLALFCFYFLLNSLFSCQRKLIQVGPPSSCWSTANWTSRHSRISFSHSVFHTGHAELFSVLFFLLPEYSYLNVTLPLRSVVGNTFIGSLASTATVRRYTSAVLISISFSIFIKSKLWFEKVLALRPTMSLNILVEIQLSPFLTFGTGWRWVISIAHGHFTQCQSVSLSIK